MTTQEAPSYLDYETFLSPLFSARSFASTLVLSTNNPSDSTLDLQSPLSRVLFDIQEIDSHIHTLTTQSAIPLLQYTIDTSSASSRILDGLIDGLRGVNASTARLQKNVVERFEAAVALRRAAENVARTLRLSRFVMRCVQLARQLELQISDVAMDQAAAAKRDDLQGLLGAASTVVVLKNLLQHADGEEELEDQLAEVNVVRSIRAGLLADSEKRILERAQQCIREFSVTAGPSQVVMGTSQSSTQTSGQIREMKTRTLNSLLILYTISFDSPPTLLGSMAERPIFMLEVLRRNIQIAVTSSVAAIIRSLGSLPTLDKTLAEVTARSQNVIALEDLLSSAPIPYHPLSKSKSRTPSMAQAPSFLLSLVLADLETTSLPSYFWLSMAGSLSTSMQDLVNRGGPSVRILKASKDKLRERIKRCISRSDEMPAALMDNVRGQREERKNWARETAVMTGAIIGPLNQ